MNREEVHHSSQGICSIIQTQHVNVSVVSRLPFIFKEASIVKASYLLSTNLMYDISLLYLWHHTSGLKVALLTQF